MHEELISSVAAELRSKLTGRFLGRIFQTSPVSIAIDFGLKGEFLFAGVDPSSPRLFIIKRRLKDLEKLTMPSQAFAQVLRAKLGDARLIDIQKVPNDRIVRMSFRSDDETQWTLVVQLTGKAANLLLLDETDRVVDQQCRKPA